MNVPNHSLTSSHTTLLRRSSVFALLYKRHTPVLSTVLCAQIALALTASIETVTRAEIIQLLSKSPSKTCKLDPMPTHFVKQCHDVMAVPITNIINKCLIDGMPDEMKAAIITPILESSSLASETLKSYRPISNMSFVSKLLERVVAGRLIAHMRDNDLYMSLQSAYRQNCSTETTLLHEHDSVIRSIDEPKGVILLLIDLSAAFDTIDHDILLNTLSNTIGVMDRCLSWFAAYLQHREYTVLIAGEQSKPHKLTYGVPQGSVLGPLLFTIYMTPPASLLKLHGMTYHLYANDTQLFQEFSLSDNTSPEIAVRKMERCVTNVRQWMKTNMLKLNDDKTEIFVIRPKSANQHLLPESVRIGNTNVTPNTQARHLGVTFDCNMSLERHVTNISRTAYYHLHSIGRIRRYLKTGHTKQLVHALVISRIDCCNSLLNGLSVAVVEKLQRVQNASARVILIRPKRDHVRPMLLELHWLPVKCRITFKTPLLTFKCFHGLAPTYLSALFSPYCLTRSLRSSDQLLLNQPTSRTKLGERSFSCAAPRAWNQLPIAVRQCTTVNHFKVALKTHLFTAYYFDSL